MKHNKLIQVSPLLIATVTLGLSSNNANAETHQSHSVTSNTQEQQPLILNTQANLINPPEQPVINPNQITSIIINHQLPNLTISSKEVAHLDQTTSSFTNHQIPNLDPPKIVNQSPTTSLIINRSVGDLIEPPKTINSSPTPPLTINRSVSDLITPSPSQSLTKTTSTQLTTNTSTPDQNKIKPLRSLRIPISQNPSPPPDTTPAPQPQLISQDTGEPRVLVGEIVIQNPSGELSNELRNIAFESIRTRPGQSTTKTQLQEDVNRIFQTGLFSKVDFEPSDTPLGVRVTFLVRPNPILQKIEISNLPQGSPKKVLPDVVVDDVFSPLYGKILNLRELQNKIQIINEWYQNNGYDLAQVIDSPEVSPEGNVTLVVAEGVIEDLKVRFINKEGNDTDAQGKPIRGKTRPFIITREMQLKSGDVFNRRIAEQDLRRVFGLGIFEDVRLSFTPGTDPRKVVVQVDTVQGNTGSIAAGAGYSSASGVFGTVSYQQNNLGGNNQQVTGELQIGERELLFNAGFTDPWIGGDPYRTSYSTNVFRSRTQSVIYREGEAFVPLPNGDDPRLLRFGGGVVFSRPLSRDVYKESVWKASLGLQYQQISIVDADGKISPRDILGNRLTSNPRGTDDLLTLQFGMSRDRRNNFTEPTSGSVLRFGVEQAIPIGLGAINLSRFRANYSLYIPTSLLNISPGPQAFAFNLQGGTILGTLPSYEAFSLGGTNSIRGYNDGEVGSGRSYVQATAEYRFPLFSFVGGTLFVDAGSTLGSQGAVIGRPGIVREKPGSGMGYGVGLRVNSPLGPIRVDYGFNTEGNSRIHFGIGQRF